VFDVPGLDIGLGAVGERAAAAGEPGEQRGGLQDLFAGVVAAGRSSARDRSPWQDVPGGEAAQDLGVVGIGAAGEVLVQPAL
jgi:hypothetical protein